MIKFNVLITHSKVEIHVIDSIGPTDLIDKIRVTRFTANEEQYRIDIHYSVSNDNKVVFKCMEELRGNTIYGNTFYYTYTPMDDNPPGENVITEVYAYKQ